MKNATLRGMIGTGLQLASLIAMLGLSAAQDDAVEMEMAYLSNYTLLGAAANAETLVNEINKTTCSVENLKQFIVLAQIIFAVGTAFVFSFFFSLYRKQQN